MKKIRINIYLSTDHPIAQIERGKRASAIYNILADWYEREGRLKRIEDTLARIEKHLECGAPIVTPKDVDHERMKDQLMMDILNLGKK